MIITLGTLGACFYVKHDDIGWLPLASFIVYRLCFKLGFGPIPALMMGEMLPIQIRGSTVSIVAVFQWLLTIIRPGMFGKFDRIEKKNIKKVIRIKFQLIFSYRHK